MKDIIYKHFEKSADLKIKFVKSHIDLIISIADSIKNAFVSGNKLLIFGNGGSAADAQHIAAEFVNRFLIERPPLSAIALTTDTSIITSIGNDYDFSQVFSRQIRALGEKGDIAWGITTSGNSKNIINGIEAAKEMGLLTIGLTGNDGGICGRLVDLHLNVPSEETPLIQEVHITVGHVICKVVEMKMFYE
jgi:D-sedoheptulose 7-phosphate isomerase